MLEDNLPTGHGAYKFGKMKFPEFSKPSKTVFSRQLWSENPM